jgi:hypothetical protein
VSEKLVDRSCFRILFLNCDISSVTQDFLFLVQESEEIRHKRVMTASQASA